MRKLNFYFVYIILQLCFAFLQSVQVKIVDSRYEKDNKVRYDGLTNKNYQFAELDIEDKRNFIPLPFPVNFRLYDMNGDGHIDIAELISVTGEAENVEQAFRASDLDADGIVTEDEYNLNPWGYNPGDDVINS